MDAVKAFNAELSALYDVKPPISKAKMNSLTRGAIKAIKFYKHVVQSVEKFILKCKPEYKVPGLYVIDSIVRQSRHQFGMEKDVFAPRFAKNMQNTFLNLLKCPQEDKSKVIRVLNLWQKNAVFPPEVIQPLFDLADPNHPIHKEQPVNSNGTLNTSAGNNISNVSAVSKTPPSTIKNTVKDPKLFPPGKTIDPVWLAQSKMEAATLANANKLLSQSNSSSMVDPAFIDQLQHLQELIRKKQEASEQKSSVKFDKKLLDFDYGEEEDDDVVLTNSPNAATSANTQHNAVSANNSLESLGLLLANPEVLRQLQTIQQSIQSNVTTSSSQHEMEEKKRKLQQMKQQEEEFDKHLAQTVPTLPFASECELKPSDILKPNTQNYAPNANSNVIQDMSQPPPGYPPALPYTSQSLSNIRQINQSTHQNQKSPLLDERQETQDYSGNGARRDSSSVEIVNCENASSPSRSPERYRHHSRSRSPRHRDRDRDRDRDRKSRSRSRSRRRRSRSRDRGRDRKRDDSREKMTEEEREKERERRKRGLPPIVRDKLSVCSTTLWVGHLSKLVHQEELSDTFGEFGDIVSIDLISPRGCAFICMNRRQDAYRALTKLKNHKMQGKAITLAWAPGKGVKGKEWKDYWEVELGVSYIPWNKLNNITDQELELLEEGGMIDEDTLPPNLKGKLKHTGTSADIQQLQQLQLQQQAMVAAANAGAPIPTLTDGIVNVMQSSANSQQQQQQQQQLIDTSQPPPIRPPTSAALLPPPNTQLQMMPPAFTMPGVPRVLSHMGIQMTHGLMSNVPIGVPPPNMQSLLGPPSMMQTMLTPSVNPPFGAGVGVGLLTQIPLPAPAAPSDKPNSTGMPHNVPPIGVPPPTTETSMPNLPMLRQPYGVGPVPPMQMQLPQQHHSDDMDVEMEDAMPPSLSSNVPKDKPNLSDQLIAEIRMESDQAREYKDQRDRERENRDRRDRNERDRGDRMDMNDCRMDRSRDRGRGRDRGRDRRRDNRDSRGERERDDRRGDRENREAPRDNRETNAPRHPEGLVPNPSIQEGGESLAKKENKPSLADRLRQLADGTLDDRMDRNIRGNRTERSNERNDRNFEDSPGAAGNGGGGGGAGGAGGGGGGGGRRPNDMPISLMDLPKFGAVLPDRTDFPRGPGAFGGALQEPREFQQRGGLADRDRPNFPPRGGGGGLRNSQMDDFLDPRMQPGVFPEDFEGGRMVGHNGPRADEPFPPRLGPAREEFDRAEVRGRRPPVDEYERERFEYDMRRDNFDPRIQDGFDPRGHNERSDFDPRRREFFGPIEPVFGMPPMMGPKGPRGPVGPDGFGPRGARGPGPLMFHPRGMGPRGMRPGMRPPFAPRGPPFDPREADSFFRPPFDDMRGRPGPHLRPPFGPMGPPAMHGPDGPWRNQEGGGPSTSWSGQEGGPDVVHGQRENHLPRDKQKLTKQHQDYKNMSERENRNRNRKSRWGNVSPPLTDADIEEVLPSEEAEGKVKAVMGRGEETKDNFEHEVPSAVAVDQPSHLRQQGESMVTQEQDMTHGNRESQPADVQMAEEHNAGEATGHSYENDKVQEANPYEIGADRFSGDNLALKQQRHEEERCEYGTLIPAEDSAQQSAVQVEQVGHVSENHSEQSVGQQVDSL